MPAWHEPPVPEPIQRIEGFDELPDLREVLELRGRVHDQHKELDGAKSELIQLRYAYAKMADQFQAAMNILDAMPAAALSPHVYTLARLKARRQKLRK